MLVINNINLIVGMLCDSQHITSAKYDAAYKRYVFTLNIPIQRVCAVIIEVMLDAIPNSTGEYELYVMGWHPVTVITINESDITNPVCLAEHIASVLVKLKSCVTF
jgi:hypothetical protein